MSSFPGHGLVLLETVCQIATLQSGYFIWNILAKPVISKTSFTVGCNALNAT